MCSYPPTVTAGDCTSTSTTNSCRFARSATNASSAEPSPEEALKSPLGGSSSLPPCQASPAGGATSSLAGAATGNRCRRSARRSGPLVAEKRLDALPTEDLTRLATAASVIPASRASSIAPGPPMHSAEAGTPAVRRRKRQRRRPETASSRNGPRPYSWAVPFHCVRSHWRPEKTSATGRGPALLHRPEHRKCKRASAGRRAVEPPLRTSRVW
jgi:hypothetical protein